MQNILEINTVADYLKLRNYGVLHPLVGIVDFNKVHKSGYTKPEYDGFHFKCFAIFLKDAEGCKLKYGGKDYDYDEGTLVFMAPGQNVEFGDYDPDYKPKGYAMIVHPDLLLGTDLARKMHLYSFFSYASHEALHLSAKERKIL